MDPSQVDLEALIAQTEALSWEDPSSQLETLTPDMKFEEAPPLVGHIISQKTLSNHLVYAALNKILAFCYPILFLNSRSKPLPIQVLQAEAYHQNPCSSDLEC
jgi:hypothetical protein